ncbi:hypothetical protein QCA50_015816 [Cerrena zonata]|uniref:SH3 domain-containing protein n=1 Tax=Cerrena zonata TaxID=2478898 RepID=A0AAW0FQJ0_9APHY
MSAATIKHSLATIKTELEFLNDSQVITDALYDKLMGALPPKYIAGMEAYDVDKLGGSTPATPATPAAGVSTPSYDARSAPPPAPQQSNVAKLTQDLSNTTIGAPPGAPPQPPRSQEAKPLGYCKALFDYQAHEADDLSFKKDEKLAVLEHLSEDWWKGFKQNEGPNRAGVFPSNYVNVISQQEFESSVSTRSVPPPPPQINEKATYSPTAYSAPPPPPQYDQYQPPPQALQPQPLYGGYAQYPPPSTNYYQQPPPQQYQPLPQPAPQQTVVEQPQEQSTMRKVGGKFGNAAIFGAGATLGGDLVNSIF